MTFDCTYLAFGAGVQSTALLLLCDKGLAPRPDFAIFADTGDEPQWVYDHLEACRKLTEIPIHVCSHGHLSQDALDRHSGKKSRFAAIPAFTLGADGRASMLRRQCTREYKIQPIEKKVRELLGYKPRKHVKHKVRALLGISMDEVSRMKPNRTPWVTNEFPLIDPHRLRRSQCEELMGEHGWPVPMKSSCVFCPYHSDGFWRRLKDHHPEEWKKAVDFDNSVRDMSRSGVRQPVYLHRSLQPLEDVDYSNVQLTFGEGFENECEGHCGL